MFAIWHIQGLCCNGGTQLCGPWQNSFPSSTDTDAKSSVPTHQVAVCLRSKYMKESLDLQNVLSISISQLALLLLHFIDIWILHEQWSTCWFCPTLSALEQQLMLLVKQLLFCGSTKAGIQVENRWKKTIMLLENIPFLFQYLDLSFLLET